MRARILELHEQGLSSHCIGRLVGKYASCVSRFVSAQQRASDASKPVRHGPCPLLSPRHEHILKRLILSGTCDTAAEVARRAPSLGLPAASAITYRRALRRQGLVARVKARAPTLTKLHRRRRLQWARDHRHWTVSDWQNVVFSDETKLLRINASGRAWCWRPSGDRSLCDRVVKATQKFGGGALLMWGCMSARGVGNACRIFMNMNSAVYVEILERHMLPSRGWLLSSSDAPYTFQQDNDPKHVSRKTRDWLARNHVATLPWPSQSPDLNPIEHLWADLKRRVGVGPVPASVDALWERLEKEWWATEPNLCRRLIESMPARINAVIKARGGHTRF